MQRARSLFLALATLAACGGIADPTRKPEAMATVSGALTGAAPGNARVALVWRNGKNGGTVVGADAPVVNGHFTMGLAVPADSYFFPAESSSTTVSKTPGQGSASSSAGSGSTVTHSLAPEDVSGQINDPLTVALAGFVVYVDTNGNGILDLAGQTASSSDQILGGNNELALAYLRGGGSLDYEKLRDKAGILPAHGFNLMWKEGRWLALDLVELELSASARLPSMICSSYGASFDSSGSAGVAASANDSAPVATPITPDIGGYPSPSDPDLICAPDGRSFQFKSAPCTAPSSPPPGLCGGDPVSYTCASRAGSRLSPGQPTPVGWPCAMAGVVGDAGAGADATTPTFDAMAPSADASVKPDAG